MDVNAKTGIITKTPIFEKSKLGLFVGGMKFKLGV